ncbi:MAG: hypothetical protein ABI743_14135, partial [bacterium]
MHKIPHDEFERFLRRNLLRAIALGYSPEEVIDSIRVITARGFDVAHAEAPVEVTAATHASHQGWTHDTAPVIAITECSIEQSEDLARDLERHLRVSAVPVVLEVLRKDPAELIKFLGPRTLYVTTPFHQVEVVEVLRKHRLEPFILDLALSREFLATLKRLERYRAVGVLCRDEESLAAASGLVRSYLRRGDGVTLIEALVDDVEAMSRLNRDAEIVIHAPNCRMEAQTLLPWGIEKVETTFEIDTD